MKSICMDCPGSLIGDCEGCAEMRDDDSDESHAEMEDSDE